MTEFRSGIGIDVHKLINGESLILGGVTIKHEFGLLGHSDGYVLTHSIIDSILGASGLGDIGSLFPSTDEQYRDISSMVLLKKTVSLAHKAGWIVKFLDATIVAQKPKVLPHVELMKTALSEVLVVSKKSVNIKATTTDKLGPIGLEQGIAATSICMIKLD